MFEVLPLLTILGILLLGLVWLGFQLVQIKEQLSKQTRKLNINNLVIGATFGGHYQWDAIANKEYISEELANLLELNQDQQNLNAALKPFGTESKKLQQQIEALKEGTLQSFLYDLKRTDKNKERHYQCSGNRVENQAGATQGIILWFYDISDYIEGFSLVSNENSKLKKQIRQSTTILDNLPFPVWERDETQQIIYHNAFYNHFFTNGKSNTKAKEAPQTTPELDKRSQTIAKKAFKNHLHQSEEMHLVLDGKRRLFQISEMYQPQEKSQIGFAFDISKQEDVSQELERHISAHDDLLESSSSAMAIYGPDMQLKTYNNAFEKLWELDEKWLASGPSYSAILEKLRTKRKLPEQANFKEFRDKQMQLFTNLIKPHNEFFYLPDGRTLRVIVIPHALGGLLFAYEDITDRLAIERSYNTLIAVQKATLDNLNEGIAVFGEDGKLKLYNPKYAEIWQLKPSFLETNPHLSEILRKVTGLFKYDNWNSFKDTLLKETSNDQPTPRRCELSNGKVILRIPVALPDGATLVSYVDITDSTLVERSLRERNEALEEADRIKTEFLANVSYELRTPLTSVLGFSETLLEQHFGKLNNKQKEYLLGIFNSSSHLMSVINDILDLASIEAGFMKLEADNVDIYNLLSTIVQLLHDRAHGKNLQIVLKCKKSIGTIFGDDRRLKQVIYNLLSNAIKFTDPNGKVIIGAAEKTSNQVEIWVEDNGIGIAESEQSKVFDRFYKTQTSRKLNKPGTGLGLSMAKNIIDMHHGKITVTSTEGKKTRFTCILKRKNPALSQHIKRQAKMEQIA